MKQKAHARKATGAKKTRTTTLKAKAKAKASPKKQAMSKLATKAKSAPRSRAKVESTLETPREPSREMESLTEQPKMKISRKNGGTFRENQRSQSQPNSVNPAGRR
ncbi:hypothetical protein [Bdellovibrio sp. HCB-162]|uniref:hypothetical protein n=1 Tax=Bdellovibrio sp. HCB-162 TaxID=3394234 RepID=UPI0039BCEFB2